jgi:hypothetical protein
MSLAKILGGIYAVMGFVFGAIISLFSVLGSAVLSGQGGGNASLLFGVGSIIILPLMYGLLGFIFGLFTGWLYNVIAKHLGGLEIELQD